MFMFMENGKTKYWQQGELKGMILARSREMAERFTKWVHRTKGATISITEIGTAEGDTLEEQLEASLGHGANAAFILRLISDDDIVCDVIEPGGA